ncbi:MAG TPA: YceI family protein [Chitinophagaceae bacterium]|nr:YceI family protein [Chitinophagaceae bacterium]
MKLLFLTVIMISCSQLSFAQAKYFSKAGKISFYSKAPLEDIEAHNTKAVSVFDLSTGQIEFSVLIKGFEFEKAKMQEHFNENYLESDKYPKAVFTGTMNNFKEINLAKDGVYNVDVSGSLQLHGITKSQSAKAVITVKGGTVSAVSDFTIALADFNIKIPALVAEKISKTVRVVVNVPSYQSLTSKS